MNGKRLFQIGLVMSGLLILTSVAFASSDSAEIASTLVSTVRQETAHFEEIAEAEDAGYDLFHGCVSGPQGGAMGVHFVNGERVGDGEVDALHPEALLYEARDGALRLVGVEYVVLADDRHANQEAPPMLMGQLFNYVGSPNRYGIPAFYELHVWAHKHNPNGMFADWNPHVSCEEYNDISVLPEPGE